MTTLTLDQIVHRDRVYRLREPITLHVTNDIAGLCVTLYGDDPGAEIRGYAPGHPDREPSDTDLAYAVCDFAGAFHDSITARSISGEEQNRFLQRRHAMTRVSGMDTVLPWSEQVIAANRERGGVAAIHGQVPAEETDEEFVRQVTEPSIKEIRP